MSQNSAVTKLFSQHLTFKLKTLQDIEADLAAGKISPAI